MAPLTIATEDGTTFNIDVDLEMELENIMALLEAESGIPTEDQLLFYSGKQITGNDSTLASYNVQPDDMLLLRQKSNAPAASGSVAGRSIEDDSETMRRQLLGNPQMMASLRQNQPELADAAVNNPARFRELLSQLSAMQNSAKLQQQHEAELLNADPYNIEAQKKIEEAIRQAAVLENLESAMENMPEAFGSVHMLYVDVEVNGKAVKAFVDSGAQATIMSPSCAERCGIMRLIDTRFAGMARGVGTAKILGRVHSAQLKMGNDLFLQCSFTIMEGRDVDLLFGLDMLKRHQACIDLAKDALVIQGREIRFLPEHELPKAFQGDDDMELDEQGNPIPPVVPPPGASTSTASSSTAASSFPGAGHSLTSPSAPTPPPARSVPTPAAAPVPRAVGGGGQFPEAAIASLMNLGVERAEAIRLLEAAGGNADLAANLLFQ
ncbi:DNA damage-inducible v-SNARE binding protein Ddi1 [Pseudohyphozyma bogoriensis]|nr:DNA damage-inducible v-SNARE binding protein Ddi1 [Pseudohyphozyma bogoriensis]